MKWFDEEEGCGCCAPDAGGDGPFFLSFVDQVERTMDPGHGNSTGV